MSTTPPLRELSPGQLWIGDMEERQGGFVFGARMTIVRQEDGGLWVHSPVALTPERRAALDALGPVRTLVAPSGFHYAHLGEFHRAYPEATVCVPPGFKKTPADLAAPHWLGTDPAPDWTPLLPHFRFQGSRLYDEFVFAHPASRTLILTDLCFHIPAEIRGHGRFVARAMGILGQFSLSHSFGWTVRDRDAVRASLRRILAWDFDRVILSHGHIQETKGREEFERVFQKFL